MNIGDFMQVVKRQGRYGTPAVLTDQATLDIIAAIDIRRKRIWSYWNWQWALEPLAFAITVGNTSYVVTSASGALVDRITDLIPRDLTVSPVVSAPPLQQLERQDFYAWAASIPSDAPTVPSKYVNLGRNAAGNWQIEIAPSPSQAFTMAGYAKKILTSFVLTDFQANTAFDYFPSGVIENLLLEGVLADIARIQGEKDTALTMDSNFERKLNMLKAEQDNAGRDDSGITTPPPDSIRFKYRHRSRRGTGVY
jgi:hypothetical protein